MYFGVASRKVRCGQSFILYNDLYSSGCATRVRQHSFAVSSMCASFTTTPPEQLGTFWATAEHAWATAEHAWGVVPQAMPSLCSTLKREEVAPFCAPIMNSLGQQPCSLHCCSSLGQPFNVWFCGGGLVKANAGCSEPAA